jgi:pimeloyl-ACP methyl ester carboxylesterase
MRVRHVALFFIIISVAYFAAPFSAHADGQIFLSDQSFSNLPAIPNTWYNNYQTALKAGDSPMFQIYTHDTLSDPPNLSVDFSELGISNPTAYAPELMNPGRYLRNYEDSLPTYYYLFGPLPISADVPDGLRTVSITATDENGNTTSTTAHITVDNTPPTLSLTDITFSSAPPSGGSFMYLSGKIDGTGTVAKVSQLMTNLLDSAGNPVVSSVVGGSMMGYDSTPINNALASSIDGTFSNVPIQLADFGDTEWFARAANMTVSLSAYDEAGNSTSTSFTVHIPTATSTLPSNVLFLPGIEGSRLYEGNNCDASASEEKLWEPYDSILGALFGAGDEKVKSLFLDSNGESVCDDVYAKDGDILDSTAGGDIYKSFIDEMNGLKTDGTINDWEPVAYDWRLSLDDLLNNGAERDGKIFYEESTTTPYIEQTLRALASTSKTGKVTIVAHSNGGLVAKALLNKLGSEAPNLVDKVILVGAPQTGAPEDLGTLLVGYDSGISSWNFSIVSSGAMQTLAQNSPAAYHLLPSADYFASIASDTTHPVASFEGHAYEVQAGLYGSTITDAHTLDTYLTDAPQSLNSSLIDYANREHTALDDYAPPAGIEVDQIAGWGADTVAGIDFYTLPLLQTLLSGSDKSYKPIFTEDGDGIVPIPSALAMASSTSVNRYWLDLHAYNKETNSKHGHADLFELPPLDDFIKNLIENSTSSLPAYISNTQPGTTDQSKELIFFLHSDQTIQVTDSSGKVTGVAPDDSVTEDIPDSSFGTFGQVKYVKVPEGNNYHVSVQPQQNQQNQTDQTNTGIISLDVEETSGDVVTASSTIANIPATDDTAVSVDVSGGGVDTISAPVVTGDEDQSEAVHLYHYARP